MMKKTALFALAALAPLTLAAHAFAADEAIATAGDAPTTVQELIVTGQITYRNRTEDAAPVLSYDQEYFQRFEPVSAGDAMKRVPSVQFLSDVLESDGARLRGLDPGYTQILINGERVPGALADRSFFVDRIPAELMERIEIIRSPSANRSGDAVAGALNIVLRDALSLNGGYVRGGATYYDDAKFAGNAGLYWGGEVGPGRLLIGANVQGRRAPKEKLSLRYDKPGGTLDNIEVQTDVRDGTDYSFNASYDVAVGGGDLSLEGYFVRTDRTQDEDSIEYKGGIRNDANLLTTNDNDLDILTDSWSLRGKYVRDMLGGRSKFKLGYAALKDDQFEFEDEIEYLRDSNPYPEADRYTRDEIDSSLKDREFSAAIEHERDLSFGKLTFGVQYNKKERDSLVVEQRSRVTIPNAPAPRPPLPGAFTVQSRGDANIEETRIDPFVMLNGKTDRMRWEVGLRYETTDVSITDDSLITGGVPIPPSQRITDNDYAVLLPSANAKIDVGDDGRINLSVARTVRRPNFDKLSPLYLSKEIGDDDFQGNPNLKPETAWGVDIGYERRLGSRGVAGVNVFYRDVTDLIEIVHVGPGQSANKLYSARNIGDGKVWGVEFDLSTSLSAVGLDDTGVFFNSRWLDSDVADFAGGRRFNDQAKYVFNVGFIQDIPTWGAAFGMTYRKQGDAFGRVETEEVRTKYGADLEAFVEKRFGQNLVVRLTGQNLLDSSKDEVFDKFGSTADQAARIYDEYELETEKAGPVFQLTARYAF